MLKALIFDLDGTLLDTMPDLVALTNAVLDAHGYPRHTTEEIASYFGDGMAVFMRRAVPAAVPDSEIDGLVQQWRDLYPQYGNRFTKPYPGMREALDALQATDIKLGVLSNKFDAAARNVIDRFFPGVFDLVRGQGPETPRKPDPTGFLAMARTWDLAPAEIGLVGDSGRTDMAVACAAGAFPIGVSWGYSPAGDLIARGARVVVDDPMQLLDVIGCR